MCVCVCVRVFACAFAGNAKILIQARERVCRGAVQSRNHSCRGEPRTPLTIASIVCGCHPLPANWKMVFCRNPDGPECVWVPEIATLASVYIPGSLLSSDLTTRFFSTSPPIPASRDTNANRFPVVGSWAARARDHSRMCRPAAVCFGLAIPIMRTWTAAAGRECGPLIED